MANSEHRPWGEYTVLDTGQNYKIKRLEILPDQRLSYQRHKKRSEYWVVMDGEGLVTLDGKEILLYSGQGVDIPRMSAHRIKNIGDSSLIINEIQRGDSFEEDDIIRLEDDYGR